MGGLDVCQQDDLVVAVAGNQERATFNSGVGTLASLIQMMDDANPPAFDAQKQRALFRSLHDDKAISLAGVAPIPFSVKFDSSWRPKVSMIAAATEQSDWNRDRSLCASAPIEILHWTLKVEGRFSITRFTLMSRSALASKSGRRYQHGAESFL